jgi:hypothetical protein
MVISYLAKLPDPRFPLTLTFGPNVPRFKDETLQSRLKGDWFGEFRGLYLMGRFGHAVRDVGGEYYRRPSSKPPYAHLAKCEESLEGLLQFTREWGSLGVLTSIAKEESQCFGDPGTPWVREEPQKNFWLDCEGWIHLKRRFTDLLNRAEHTGTSSRSRNRALEELIEGERWHAYDTGFLRLGLDWDKKRKAAKPMIVADSLYQAFVGMLWLDVSERSQMLLRCADPNCGAYFVSSNSRKIFCDPACGAKVSKRKWWANTGGERRKARGRYAQ